MVLGRATGAVDTKGKGQVLRNAAPHHKDAIRRVPACHGRRVGDRSAKARSIGDVSAVVDLIIA